MTKDDQDKLDTLKSATLAAVKALSEDDEVVIEYVPRSQNLREGYVSGKTIKLPHPSKALLDPERAALRGHADTLALKLKHHNAKEFFQDMPTETEAKEIFEVLEKARCESLAAKKMRGVKQNIYDATEQRYAAEGYQNITHKDDAPLAEAVYLLARKVFSNQEIPPSGKALTDVWQSWLELRDSQTALKKMDACLEDQKAFADMAKRFIQQLDMLQTPGPDELDNTESDEDQQSAKPDEQQAPSQEDQKSKPQQSQEKEDLEQQESNVENLGMGDAQDGQADPQMDGEAPNQSPEGQLPKLSEDGHGPEYGVYTTKFDEIIRAEELSDTDELRRLRDVLDHQLKHFQTVVAKLANRLQRRVLAKQQRGWEYNVDEGVIDPRRLSQIVADPTTPISYMREKDIEFKDTVVSLLIDNSGSMRGRPISIAAISTDVMARTLERCGVKVEILGFTTRSWKGGKSRDLWLRNERPENPGRLNDLRHIIYKSADAPWRRTRINLGLMLKEGLLKENIDGEALLWAHKRLMQRPEKRKILMVISDGAPVDDSTLSSNPPSYLETDLHNVIHWIEKKKQVELSAIGIGHDVTKYYRRAVTLTDAQDLAGAMIDRLTELFEEK